MTNEEASKERDRGRQESSERANKERNQSTKDRAKEIKEQNSERRQQRDTATNALTSGSADIKLSEIAKLGGPVGRKLEREIRQFQQTGRVSSWLAGETLKAEAAQNAAQQSKFREQVIDVISNPLPPIQVGPLNSYIPQLSKKPEVQQEGGGGGGDISHPFKVITRTIDGDLYWGILETSYAWTFMAPADQGDINGMLTTGGEGDPNWIEITATSGNPDYIYLEYDQDNTEIKISTVGGGDGNFDPTINNVESSGNWLEIELDGAIADFKFARKIIARADLVDGDIVVTQFVRNHQLLQDICYNGNPARYWFDFSKGNEAP